MSSVDVILDHDREDVAELLTVYISGQQFGIPILQVQDVLAEQHVTPIPLSNHVVEGALNLRGRIVTAINVRKRLGLPQPTNERRMSVVVEHENELFSLIIDNVGDVLKLDEDDFDSNPATLDPLWRDVSLGIYRLKSNLLVVLDIPKLLDFNAS
jgi:purine-binding chemotaxis protein CheW